MATIDNDEFCIMLSIVAQQYPDAYDNAEYKAVIYKAKSLIVVKEDGMFYTKPVHVTNT